MGREIKCDLCQVIGTKDNKVMDVTITKEVCPLCRTTVLKQGSSNFAQRCTFTVGQTRMCWVR